MSWAADDAASRRLLPAGLAFSDTPSRFVAYLLDGMVVGVINAVPLSLLGIDAQAVGTGLYPDRLVFALSEAIGLLLYAAYFIWFWSGGRRATPGQRVFGIQVAHAFDGRPLTARQAFKRWFATGQWLGAVTLQPVLFLALVGIVGSGAWNLVLLFTTVTSPTKQGLHDRFAESAAVRPARAGNRWAAGCLWALVIVGALYAVLLIGFLVGDPRSTGSDQLGDYLRDYLRWLWPL